MRTASGLPTQVRLPSTRSVLLYAPWATWIGVQAGVKITDNLAPSMEVTTPLGLRCASYQRNSRRFVVFPAAHRMPGHLFKANRLRPVWQAMKLVDLVAIGHPRARESDQLPAD